MVFEGTYFLVSMFLACTTADVCVNGGTCTDGICHCTSDYFGNRCQLSKNKYIYIGLVIGIISFLYFIFIFLIFCI